MLLDARILGNPRARLSIAPVLGAIASATLISSCCCKTPSPSRRSSVASATPSASSSATAFELPVVKIGPGDDLAPFVASTPEESLAARPSWASKEGYAPSLWEEAAAKLFDEASSTPGKVEGNENRMLVCRANYAGYPDALFYTSPELDVELTVGKHGGVIAHGPEDTHVAHLTAPVVRIAPDTPLSIHLYDRDSVSRDDLGNSNFPRGDTLPVTFKKGDTRLECRGVDPAALDTHISERMAVADEAVSELARVVTSPSALDLDDADLGFSPRFKNPRAQVGWIASDAGWADPRVVRRVRWLDRLEAQFSRIATPVIDRIYASAPRTGHWTDSFDEKVEATALGATCGMDARKKYAGLIKRVSSLVATSPCVYRISLRPMGTSSFSLDLGFHRMGLMLDTVVAFQNGLLDTPIFADLDGIQSTDPHVTSREIKAGETRTALFVSTREVDTTDPDMVPKLFMIRRRVGADSHPVRLKLRE